MLRHQWYCNSIMFWLGRELGWDLLSEKNQIGSKKLRCTFSFLKILGFQVLKSFLGPIMGKTSD